MNQPASAIPRPIRPPAPAPSFFRRVLRAIGWLLKLAYAFAAGIFAVWVVSFTPGEGPELTAFVPARAAFVVHVRDGSALMNAVAQNPAALELLDDPDFRRLCKNVLERSAHPERAAAPASTPAPSDDAPPIATQLRAEYDSRLAALPDTARYAVRKILPPRLESLFPIAGREVIFARMAEDEPDASTSTDGQKKNSAPKMLLIARVSGGPGLAARLAAHFSKNTKTHAYDLGGDVVALGFNGAAPAWKREWQPERHVALPDAPTLLPLARITVLPLLSAEKPHDPDYLTSSPLAPYLDALSGSITHALLKPPAAAEMLGMKDTPREISIGIFANPEGSGVVAYGDVLGGVPALPLDTPDPAREQRIATDNDPASVPYLDGLLPFSPRACFLSFLASELHPPEKGAVNPATGKPRGLSRSQKRWIDRMIALENNDIDLDTSLWPAFGPAIRIRIDDPPPDLSPTGYGLLRAAMKFNGELLGSRQAAAELIRSNWELYGAAPGNNAHMPYVRVFESEAEDRYVLATGEISAPSWTVSQHTFSATLDAGVFALLRSGPPTAPPPTVTPPQPAPPKYFFIKLDGRRVAPNVETYLAGFYNDLGKDLGSKTFLEKHPDAELNTVLARKLCGLAGDLQLALTPSESGDGNGTLRVVWKPGTVKIASARHDAVPPGKDPHAPHDTDDPIEPVTPKDPSENPNTPVPAPPAPPPDDSPAPPPASD